MKKVLIQCEKMDGTTIINTWNAPEFKRYFDAHKTEFKIVFAFVEEDEDYYDAWFWTIRARTWVHVGAIIRQ